MPEKYYSGWGRPVGLTDGEAGIKTSYSPTGAWVGAELGKNTIES